MAMEKKFLDYDPFTGVTRWFFYDHNTDEWYIKEEQDVGELVTITKEEQKEMHGQRFGDGRIVARIPIQVWQDLVKKGIANDEVRLAHWLDDSDNQVFRAFPGILNRK